MPSLGVSLPRPADAAVPTADARSRGALLQSLFRAHGAFVLRTVRNLGVNPGDVEDAAQEVFIVAHRKLDQLNPESDVRSWLFAIARRVAAAQRRKAHVRRERPDEDVAMRMEQPPLQERDIDHARARALLTGALESLDDDKRAVFVLYELEGVLMPEAARMLECPLQTAYSRLKAAREIVQKYVEQRTPEVHRDR